MNAPTTDASLTQAPYRGRQSVTLSLDSNADQVFALMCPVREYDWIEGWETASIHTNSGLVELDCVFETHSANPHAAGINAVWVAADHDPAARVLRLYKIDPGVAVTRLDISVVPHDAGCQATITYQLTALSADGRKVVDGLTEEAYGAKMAEWKRDIEAYLAA